MRKYNPGFLSDDELVTSFCVRQAEFELLVDVLHECTGSANQHQLVIGPRGSGKTSLLLRIAAEVRRDARLAVRYFPIVFAEESYEVATAGEFWLECLSHLAAQSPRCEDGPDLQRTVEESRATRDDQFLADRCLGALLDFADRRDKRLLLVVENLNTLFRDMTDRDVGWKLRKVLQTEPRIILFASATSRFDEIDHPDRALYDLLQVRNLRPLDTEQCAVLWETVAGREPARRTVRSLEVLTGGSPRLIAIVARFGGGLSFGELMADLLDLVDDHTEYFKGHLDSLPAQERRVYLALATLWKPATTREIADHARLDTSTCSAQLARLTERGVVQIAGGSPRRKQYYLTERLYNIYYLLRRRHGSDPLVEALVQFMASYYSPIELWNIGTRMLHELGDVDEDTQSLHRTAFTRLVGLPALAEHRSQLIEHFKESHRQAESTTAGKLLEKAFALATQNRDGEAIGVYEEIVGRFGGSEVPFVLIEVPLALLGKASALGNLHRPQEALAWCDDTITVCDDTIKRFGKSKTFVFPAVVAAALAGKMRLLRTLERPDDALVVCDELIQRFGAGDITDQPERVATVLAEEVATVLADKGALLASLGRFDEALAVCDDMVHRWGATDTPAHSQAVAVALVIKGDVFVRLERFDEALAVCDDMVGRFGAAHVPRLMESVALAFWTKALALDLMNRSEEALPALDEAVRRLEESTSTLADRAMESILLQKADSELKCRRYQAAVTTADRLLAQLAESSGNRWQAHLARARAFHGMSGPSDCEPDIEATLRILPELEVLPPECLDTLTGLSIEIGPKRMLELIQASPSATLLLPLTTALEKDLGLQPRVAREIEEVAQDIHADLSVLRAERAERPLTPRSARASLLPPSGRP